MAQIHTADKLKVWGISHSHITKWKITIEDNVSENLDEEQESGNQLESIQPQPPLSVIQSVSTAVDSTWTEPVTERLMVVPKVSTPDSHSGSALARPIWNYILAPKLPPSKW